MMPQFEIAFLIAYLFACLSGQCEATRQDLEELQELSVEVFEPGTTTGANNNVAPKQPGGFFLIQVADPQLGMKNYGQQNVEIAKKYDLEKRNLEVAVDNIIRLKPAAVVMSGDMQNFWSQDWSNSTKNLALGPRSGVGDHGKKQAQAVKTQMQRVLDARIPVSYTPGNHDLDDTVKMQDITRYTSSAFSDPRLGGWQVLDTPNQYQGATGLFTRGGSHGDYGSFWIHEVFFISINSQLYWKKVVNQEEVVDPDPEVEQHRDAQTKWIIAQLGQVRNANPKAIVVLTHIPPFIGSYGEDPGWANWHTDFRTPILDKLMDDAGISPELWLCGHFHGNVRSIVQIKNKRVEIMTTGSVGSTMRWNDTDAYTPDEASSIAAEPDGSAAFENRIVARAKWYVKPQQQDFNNMDARIQPNPAWSGLRVVQFYADGHYRHKWFTLQDIAGVSAINEASMAGACESGEEGDPNARQTC